MICVYPGLKTSPYLQEVGNHSLVRAKITYLRPENQNIKQSNVVTNPVKTKNKIKKARNLKDIKKLKNRHFNFKEKNGVLFLKKK